MESALEVYRGETGRLLRVTNGPRRVSGGMSTFTYDLRVQGCTHRQLSAYARAVTGRPAISLQPVDAPAEGPAAYRVVVRPAAHGTDAATTVATLAWMLRAAGRLISLRPRT
jgi:hypothetical protein